MNKALDGSWSLIARSAGHTLVALADTRRDVWSAACSMAMRLRAKGTVVRSLLNERD